MLVYPVLRQDPPTKAYGSSLLHRSAHPPELLLLMRSPVTPNMIRYLAMQTKAIIACDEPTMHYAPLVTPPTSPEKGVFQPAKTDPSKTFPGAGSAAASQQQQQPTKEPEMAYQVLPTLEQFIAAVVDKSHVHTPTLLCTLIYLDRLGRCLPPGAHGLPCTRHRVFLAALIISAKYLNDCAPQNSHWAKYVSSLMNFSLREVAVMEKQALGLLDFRLNFTQHELIHACRPFFAHPLSAPLPPQSMTMSKTFVDLPRRTQRWPTSTVVAATPLAAPLSFANPLKPAKGAAQSHLGSQTGAGSTGFPLSSRPTMAMQMHALTPTSIPVLSRSRSRNSVRSAESGPRTPSAPSPFAQSQAEQDSFAMAVIHALSKVARDQAHAHEESQAHVQIHPGQALQAQAVAGTQFYAPGPIPKIDIDPGMLV